jgi:hypothetical protein
MIGALLSPTAPTYFVHEVGHTFGLVHTFAFFSNDIDPETGIARKKATLWDLFYKPGTSAATHTFYDSQTAAAVDEASLALIDRGTNCTGNFDGAGRTRCSIDTTYPVNKDTGDPAMKGLGFTYGGPDSPPSSYKYGTNLMSYMWKGDASDSFSFSASQLAIVRANLRYDVPNDKINYPGQPGSLRPQLGRAPLRSPSYKLDFDGDGKRDIGIYTPTITSSGAGKWEIFLSSTGYTTSIVKYWGGLGDLPMAADFNGDGKTDFALFRTGATYFNSSFRWCTGTDTGSTGCASTYSLSEDKTAIPYVGVNFDSNAATSEILFHHPLDNQWIWYSTSGATGYVGPFGLATDSALPGLYDGDNLTDLAVYRPSDASLRLRTSTSGWNSFSDVTRTFASSFASNPAGTTVADRGGAVPVPMLSTLSGSRQLGFGLWDVNSGVWNVMWNPATSSTTGSCTWGVSGDVPIGGLLDRLGDGQNDFVVFRPEKGTGTGTLWMANNSGTGCSGYTSIATNARANALVFAVSDMTGDGKDELMIVDPALMTFTYRTSESQYATVGGTFTLSTQSGTIL